MIAELTNGSIGCYIATKESVSYTHLDVYKRQEQIRVGKNADFDIAAYYDYGSGQNLHNEFYFIAQTAAVVNDTNDGQDRSAYKYGNQPAV